MQRLLMPLSVERKMTIWSSSGILYLYFNCTYKFFYEISYFLTLKSRIMAMEQNV